MKKDSIWPTLRNSYRHNGTISLYGTLSGKSDFAWFYFIASILMVIGGIFSLVQFLKKP